MASAQHAPGMPVAVLGSGSWGTALALLVARNGHDTWLWSHEAPIAARMHSERRNPRYLSEFQFPDNLTTTGSLRDLADRGAQFLVAVPSHAFRATLARLRDFGVGSDDRIVAWGTKGLEPGSGKLLESVAREVLGEAARVGLVSGPTFAREVARGLPTAITAVSRDAAVAESIAGWLRNERVRVYTNDDVTGVQLGGAIKNVMAIAAGISDGLGFGANARAALITRGLAELSRLGVALGGRAETFMGLTGVGDLILTCTDDQSRNRRVGLALGAGRTLEQALGDLAQEAEGVNTARELYRLAGTKAVEMPITEQVYRVLYEDLAAAQAVEALLSREPKKE